MSLELFDEPGFMASLVYDKELARELLEAFLEDGPKRMGGLSEALNNGDALQTSKLAHSLKGMCGVVHAQALADMALEVEYAAREGNLAQVVNKHAELKDIFSQVIERMQTFLKTL